MPRSLHGRSYLEELDFTPAERDHLMSLAVSLETARVGDHLVIKAHHVGEPDRAAQILEVHGDNGSSPYLVLWSDDGHERVLFPGLDARVEHLQARPHGALRAEEQGDE